MFALFGELFSYSFLVRALIVGSLVALCAALLGVSLVLKRYSMIGDGLSHVGFGALSIAMAMNAAPLAVAIPVVIVAAFLLLRISQNSRLGGDSAIALISSGALAAGVLVTSLTSGLNADVYSYMFGSILAMSEGDVYLSLALAAVVLVLFIVFYNRIFAITFDESFARATGTRVSRYNMLLALLTALTIVIGMRIMGTMLISRPHHLPCAYRHARVPLVPGRCRYLGYRQRILLLYGHDALLCVGNARRSEHRCC